MQEIRAKVQLSKPSTIDDLLTHLRISLIFDQIMLDLLRDIDCFRQLHLILVMEQYLSGLFSSRNTFFDYAVTSIKMQGGKQKEKGSGAVQSAEKLINVAKQMKDFLVQSYESTIDLQNRVKGAGFSYLNMDCVELEVWVNRPKAQKIIDRCLDNLRDLVPQKILAHVIGFFEDWQDIPRLLFHKKEILFSSNTSANASFLGAYFRSKDDKVFVAYKFIKSAFTLAKDVYVVHEVESSSAFFGAFQSSSKRDYLQELNRGFTRQDLALLMDMATFSIFSPENLKALQ